MTKKSKAKTKSYIKRSGEAAALDADYFRTARLGRPPLLPEERKRKVTIMLDPDVVEYFRRGGPGWQTRLNEALRKSMARKRA
jgi:uncharacterized protein (DUF4415 family)